jgi:hypothetical protein
MTPATAWALLLNAGATLYMTGLIWFVQVVHYPLLAAVDRDGFTAYQTAHVDRTTLVVGPAMLIEAAAASWLVAARPSAVPARWAWTGLVLVGVAWASTALLQVPQHNRLLAGFEAGTHRLLVATNWIRTLAWTARAVLALALLRRGL